MNTNKLIERWKTEESIADIHGWDFSHIAGRYTEEDNLPWDYREVILWHLTPEMKILDIDTGGGEFLLSLGVDYRPTDGCGTLPLDDGSFDMVIKMVALIWSSIGMAISMSGRFIGF